MTEHYRFEQLDRETRDYLVHARDQQGKGTPGVFVGRTDYLPVVSMVAGFGVLALTVLITFPPTDPPVKEALLQTAGLVLGGWLVLAALRVWMSGRSGGYLGQFVYADPEYLYEARGAALDVTDLADLREAKAVHNYHDGKYQNTSINLHLGRGRRTVKVPDEERGRRLATYLNAVAFMRDGGENGKEDVLRTLPSEAMGAAAKHVAATGELPADPTRADEGHGVRVARPQRVGRASTGVFGMLLIAAVGTGIFFGLMTVNYPFRDEAVYGRIQSLPDKEKVPALRLYLANDHFTAHRDDARRELARVYEAAVRDHVQGTDPDARRGLAEAVTALKDKPAGALSLRAVEERSPNGLEGGAVVRQRTVADKLADKWGITIGDELVAFAVMEDPDLPTNVELRWKVTDDREITYTLSFRHSPDGEPFLVKTGWVAPQPDINGRPDVNKAIDALVNQVISMTVGEPKIRPVLPLDEF